MNKKYIRITTISITSIIILFIIYAQSTLNYIDIVNKVMYGSTLCFALLSIIRRKHVLLSLSLVAACFILTTDFKTLSRENPALSISYYVSSIPIFIGLVVGLIATSTNEDEYLVMRYGMYPIGVIFFLLYVTNIEHFAYAINAQSVYKIRFGRVFYYQREFIMITKVLFMICVGYLFNLSLYFEQETLKTGPYKRTKMEVDPFDY